MLVRSLIVGSVILAMAGPCAAAPPQAAGDQLTLTDGSIVKGLVTSVSNGPRGSVEFLVRRAWAEKLPKQHLRTWDRSTAASTRAAIEQRRKRLESWRRERAPFVDRNDQIVGWINHELARLSAAHETPPSVLLKVRLPRSQVRELDRRAAPVEWLLRLAWLCELPDPETMQLDDLKTSLEARGYALDAIAHKPPASLDRLLPLATEPEARWLARRAATELSIDSDLRFVRFQDTVLPDPGAGQPMSGVGLSTAVSEVKRLLDLDQGPRTDPLAEKLKNIGARGRSGAAVTRLVIQPDLSNVTVESSLWVRNGPRWFLFGSRNATVRPDELENDAGKELAEDPQVKSAFQIVDLLGLGTIPPEVKQRSLRIGAASEKALGMARTAFNQDLADLALPILEPRPDRP